MVRSHLHWHAGWSPADRPALTVPPGDVLCRPYPPAGELAAWLGELVDGGALEALGVDEATRRRVWAWASRLTRERVQAERGARYVVAGVAYWIIPVEGDRRGCPYRAGEGRRRP